jgi:hypothetical protein
MILAAWARISESLPSSVAERSDRNSRSSSNASKRRRREAAERRNTAREESKVL